jgi:thiosulfate/3-mercaptopyruvate sulfurtransferase
VDNQPRSPIHFSVTSQTNFSPVISAQEVSDILGDEGVGLVDCRFSLDDTERGMRDWSEERIPGAVYAHLDHDLSAPITKRNEGRHPMPPPTAIAALRASWGFGEDTLIVCYDDAGGAFAGRLWWMLSWIGHEGVCVLDGGWPAWQRGDYPTTRATAQPTPEAAVRSQNFTPRKDWVIPASQIEQDEYRLIDARAQERYEGLNEPIDAVAGHIPGAKNLPWKGNLRENGQFLSAEALRERWDSVGGTDRAIVYCGSGVTACHNILAAAIAGLPLPRLFPPSWSGWISDPDNPIESSAS